jgi:hypothetical protein
LSEKSENLAALLEQPGERSAHAKRNASNGVIGRRAMIKDRSLSILKKERLTNCFAVVDYSRVGPA